MIGYASNTGTLRNLAALRAAQWRILVTPDKPKPPSQIRYGIDNGAWGAYQKKESFDSDAFGALIEKHGASADFVIAPDIVAGGVSSLELSLSWKPVLKHLRSVLLPLQDGMTPALIVPALRDWPGLGLFLGGSTDWKLRNIYIWGAVAHTLGRYYHVGRVNTRRRIRLCAEAGANSFDGTSASMYACTLPLLDASRRQPSLLTPGVFA